MLLVVVKYINIVIYDSNSCDEEGRSVSLRVSFLGGMIIPGCDVHRLLARESKVGYWKEGRGCVSRSSLMF